MTNSRWTTLGCVLILATMLAQPLVGRSLGGAIADLCVNAFALGILFRGMVDGRRRLRAKADAIFDDLAKIREDQP